MNVYEEYLSSNKRSNYTRWIYDMQYFQYLRATHDWFLTAINGCSDFFAKSSSRQKLSVQAVIRS